MSEALLVVQQGFGLAVLLAVPLVLAGVLGSVLASIIGQLTGVSDPSLPTIARAVSVVLAAVLVAGTLAQETVTFARESLSRMAGVGNGR